MFSNLLFFVVALGAGAALEKVFTENSLLTLLLRWTSFLARWIDEYFF
jgi:hypothetical protein